MKDSSGSPSSRSSALLWIVIVGGLALAAAALALALTGSGSGAASGEISTTRLNQELASVLYLEKLSQGFDFKVKVVCQPNEGDLVHFACGVQATTAGRPAVFWTEFVTCANPGDAKAQRCETSSGYSLQ